MQKGVVNLLELVNLLGSVEEGKFDPVDIGQAFIKSNQDKPRTFEVKKKNTILVMDFMSNVWPHIEHLIIHIPGIKPFTYSTNLGRQYYHASIRLLMRFGQNPPTSKIVEVFKQVSELEPGKMPELGYFVALLLMLPVANLVYATTFIGEILSAVTARIPEIPLDVLRLIFNKPVTTLSIATLFWSGIFYLGWAALSFVLAMKTAETLFDFHQLIKTVPLFKGFWGKKVKLNVAGFIASITSVWFLPRSINFSPPNPTQLTSLHEITNNPNLFLAVLLVVSGILFPIITSWYFD